MEKCAFRADVKQFELNGFSAGRPSWDRTTGRNFPPVDDAVIRTPEPPKARALSAEGQRWEQQNLSAGQ